MQDKKVPTIKKSTKIEIKYQIYVINSKMYQSTKNLEKIQKV